MIDKIADVILEKPYEAVKEGENTKLHCVEDATSHFVIKKLLQLNKDEKTDENLKSKSIYIPSFGLF